jgi:hypothetical protein
VTIPQHHGQPTQHQAESSAVPTLAHARQDGVVGEYSYTVEVTYPGHPTNVADSPPERSAPPTPS